MSIQEILLSNSQKKKLLKIPQIDTVLFEDDNGELVINAEAYLVFKKSMRPAPIEQIIGDEVLDFDSEYFVFI